MDPLLERIQQFCDASGPSGFEGPVRTLFEESVAPYADAFQRDRLGSSIAVKTGDPEGPRVLLAAHLDEVGFLITRITEEGFLRFQTLGGWWEQVMLAQRVLVETRQGPLLGVIGAKPPHILSPEDRKKPVERKDMYIDIGASCREEAESFGVRPGDPAVPWSPFRTLKNPDYLMGKAWDDRYGVVAMVEVLARLQGRPHPNIVLAAATVQEEVGLRGATTVANIAEADVSFVLDVGIAGDTPGVEEEQAAAKLGKGPTLLLYDGSLIPHRGLRDFVRDTARAEGIPLQLDHLAQGGTDGGAIHKQGRGVPTVVLGVPTRYIHSHSAIFHRQDLEQAIALLVACLTRLDKETVSRLAAG